MRFQLYRRIALLVLVCGPCIATAQDSTTQFVLKVNTQLVVETVSVKDKSGKPIEGLTAGDFVVTEDGVPQTISVFEFQRLDDTPVHAAPAPAVTTPPDAPRTALAPRLSVPTGEVRYKNRRLLALFFDMGSMSEADRYRAIEAARRFIDQQLTAADLVSVYSYSNGAVRLLADFSSDAGKLEKVLDALLAGTDDEEQILDTSGAFGQNAGEFNIFNTDRKLMALQTTAKMLGSFTEEKSLIYFAGGLNLNGVDNQAQLRATLNAARRANVRFYPVDARGLAAVAPVGDATRPSPGGLAMYTGASAIATMKSFQRSQDALYTLAADTGGKALLDNNDLAESIRQAQRDTSSYYILGYYPTNTSEDGRLRHVKITLKTATANVAYRETYYANKDFSKFTAADKERQLEDALLLGDPITDLTIALELNYFQLNRAEYFVPIAAKIPGSELVLAQKSGAEHTLIDFIGEIKDEFGTTITNLRDKVEIRLKGEAANRLASSPIQYDAGFTLLPGKYTIKFLARNAETGRIGTYQTDFAVPDLNKEEIGLPISSVVLSSQRVAMEDALFNTGKTRAAKAQIANPLIDEGQKLIPSVTRVFSKARDMYVYLQAYERDAKSPEPLVVFVSFYRGQERVLETSAFAVTDGFDAKSTGMPVRLTLSLNDLAPNEYDCQVTVLDPASQKAAFWQAPVVVVP